MQCSVHTCTQYKHFFLKINLISVKGKYVHKHKDICYSTVFERSVLLNIFFFYLRHRINDLYGQSPTTKR